MSIKQRLQTLVILGEGDVLTAVGSSVDGTDLYAFTQMPERREPGTSAEDLAEGYTFEHAQVLLHYKNPAAVDRTIADLVALRDQMIEVAAKVGEE